VRLRNTLRSASFKLTAAYVALFTLSVGLLATVTYFSVQSEMSREFHGRIQSESSALEADFKAGGVRQVLRAIADRQRGRLADGLDFTLFDAKGQHLFGTLPRVACNSGWTTLTGPPDGDEAPGEMERLGVFVTPLPNGLCLLVGDDWGEVENFGDVILKTFGWVFLLSLSLAVIGGLFLSSRFLKRIDVINRTAEAIIEGDLNRRIPRRNAPDDLDRLAATLNRMLDRNSSLMESLKHLANNIAHDLRTPLGRLRRLLDAGRESPLSPEESNAVIEQGVVEIDGILDLFAAILRISQIESGNRRGGFQRICLSDLVADISETFGPAMEEDGRQLRQEIESGLWVQGDQELLTLSVANLLENAATHTPVNSRITVSLKKVRNKVQLDVADDGPGVPEEERQRIFQRFYRLEESRTTAGNGLGLSIVAAVADLHAAQINAVDNNPGLKIAMQFPSAA